MSSRSSSARCSSLASRASWMPAHHSSLPASAAADRRMPSRISSWSWIASFVSSSLPSTFCSRAG